MATEPAKPHDRVRLRRTLPNASGGPWSFPVPEISITHKNEESSLLSSTNGEKPPAHSSKTFFAAVSSIFERSRTVMRSKVSSSTRLMPHSTPNLWATSLHEQTCCKGGSPSRTAHGLACKSNRRRSSACTGNSGTRTHAYNFEALIFCLPSLFGYATLPASRSAAVCAAE